MATRAVEKVRRYDPAETRQRVLEAANELFSTKGFVATGTADIARAADVSEGSIFYHFGSKKKLLEELGRVYGERMVAAMQFPGEDLADIVPETSIRRCFAYVMGLKGLPANSDVIAEDCMVAKAIHEHSPETEPFYLASRSVVVAWTESHLRAMEERFGPQGIHIPTAAALMYAAVHEAIHQATEPDLTDAQREAVVAETVRFIGNAVCPIQLAAARR